LPKAGPGGRSSFSGVVATVFGATGFLGRYVLNRLGRSGNQIIVPYRGDEMDYRSLRLMGDLGQIMFFDYYLKDVESVAKMIKHSNCVINLIGRQYETRNFSFNDAHCEGARVIAQAAREAGVKRLIHVSALNASEESPSKFLQSKVLICYSGITLYTCAKLMLNKMNLKLDPKVSKLIIWLWQTTT